MFDGIHALWGKLSVSKEELTAFSDELKEAGKLKEPGVKLMKEERHKIFSAESAKLVEELGMRL